MITVLHKLMFYLIFARIPSLWSTSRFCLRRPGSPCLPWQCWRSCSVSTILFSSPSCRPNCRKRSKIGFGAGVWASPWSHVSCCCFRSVGSPGLEETLLVFHHGVSGRDIVLIVGGLFLIYKATTEIQAKRSRAMSIPTTRRQRSLLCFDGNSDSVADIVFSLDSVITAVGMVEPEKVLIMILAVIIAVVIMLFAADPISAFVQKHPTVKMLALSFWWWSEWVCWWKDRAVT